MQEYHRTVLLLYIQKRKKKLGNNILSLLFVVFSFIKSNQIIRMSSNAISHVNN